METILTLIAGSGSLDHSDLAAARNALDRLGASAGEADWLAPGRACDLPFAGADPADVAIAVRAALSDRPIDLVAQAVADRRKRLLVADMESTIIDNEMIDELAGELGLEAQMSELTARTMRGELDFAASLVERVRMLEGLDAEVLDRFQARIRVNPGARELIATMRANGARCVLVSGGFTAFSNHVRALVGFDADQANRLEIVDGRLTGRVVKPILDRHAKQACLLRLMAELSLVPRQTMAVGDGANDLSMVQAAGLGVAYHGKPILAETAALRVDHGDLTALLFAQGYRADEIVTAG